MGSYYKTPICAFFPMISRPCIAILSFLSCKLIHKCGLQLDSQCNNSQEPVLGDMCKGSVCIFLSVTVVLVLINREIHMCSCLFFILTLFYVCCALNFIFLSVRHWRFQQQQFPTGTIGWTLSDFHVNMDTFYTSSITALNYVPPLLIASVSNPCMC